MVFTSRILDQWEGPGSENIYLSTRALDAKSKRQSGMLADEGVLLVDAGLLAYGADLYFSTKMVTNMNG